MERGYRGEAEPFLYSSPLPVTDAVIGKDGALYFTIGGRGSQSALLPSPLHRQTNPPTPPTEVNDANVKARGNAPDA